MSDDVAHLSHVDESGSSRMVDVSDKDVTRRRAVARARVRMSIEAAEALRSGNLPKGSPVEVIRLAALQGAKQASTLLPLCHPLRMTHVEVVVAPAGGPCWEIRVEVRAIDRTGVEMEAMTGAAVGALALYDMIKAVDRDAVVEEVALLEKEGGKSGHHRRTSEGDHGP